MTRKLRLVKLVVQPLFVIDDGENLEEYPGQVFDLRPRDIDAFPEKWAADFAALRRQVETGGE